ncbi:2733_t:CDS:2, partial [Racocetra persica]
MQKRQQGYIQLSNSASLTESSAQKPSVIDPQTEPQVGGRARVKSKQPNRTTKTSQKLKLFPEEQTNVEETIDGKYNQIGQLTQGTARREAERLSKQERLKLPRVTAYCTAATYRLDDLMKYLQNRKVRNRTAPKRLDECIYTPFSFRPPKPPTTADLLGIEDSVILPQEQENETPEIIFFEYGVVVIWGMKEVEEKSLLRELVAFEDEKLAPAVVETEEFHFHYAASYQP